jgi:hypothetical protein
MLGRAGRLFEKIWPAMTAPDAMGPPILDNAAVGQPGLCSGDGSQPDCDDGRADDAIDVYIVDSPIWRESDFHSTGEYAGVTIPSPLGQFGLSKSSAFLLLPFDVVQQANKFHTTAIHELFHVLQYAHNRPLTDSDWWFNEASARWAEAHFDRVLAPWGEWTNGEVCFDGTSCPQRGAYGEVYGPWFVDGYQAHEPTQSGVDRSRESRLL